MSDLATKLVSADATTPGANTNFGSFTVPGWCTRITVTVAQAGGGTLSINLNGNGLVALNSGTALTAAALYAFTVPVLPGDTVVFQTTGAGALTNFRVDGIPS